MYDLFFLKNTYIILTKNNVNLDLHIVYTIPKENNINSMKNLILQ